ncbi:MAG: 2-amino-4-hydroxy-6-hydroxymethyldihydropteridine pyrophosphokinase [Syntrophorhabdaceae bacterium PtaU1.Bin034]|nr:MAG: 2-amino-4-hydroxy-6-hydroxymethyldihydropteridine pyrophosphokinase [Syntrophorhabdaceae bacterium PtaU1.Bin034]
MTKAAYIGVGSNIDDSYKNCLKGLRAVINDERVRYVALSSFYRTSPVSPVKQADFINCALKIEWAASPVELLSFLNGIEFHMGRERTIPLGPRVLDLDILLYGDLLLDEPELTIPHPRLHQRKFALVPCLEIDPDLSHPRLGLPLAAFLKNVGDEQKIAFLGRITVDELLSGGKV